MTQEFPLFDAHFHVIDPRFPLMQNEGYLPETFTCDDYLERMKAYRLRGGAVVSGSFQAFDQSYLLDALARLGPSYVGVTQLPSTVTDEEILELAGAGVRGLRFNLVRGGSEDVRHLTEMAARVHEVAGWHVEMYIDSANLEQLQPAAVRPTSVSIDHLGLSKSGLHALIRMAERGAHVKASGFGRVDFDVACALRDLYEANPAALMFGTDLPSTRAARPFMDSDFDLVVEAIGDDGAIDVLCFNALRFYRAADSIDIASRPG